MRTVNTLAVVIALVAASAPSAGADKGGRARPTITAIKAPKGAGAVKVPTGVRTTPPDERWWEATSPCPSGATLSSKVHGVTRHACVDAEGRGHGPYTELEADGSMLADGWEQHGVAHGLARRFWGGSPFEERVIVDGRWHGDAIESGSRGAYKRGERHGRWTVRGDSGAAQHGYYVNGKREGTWLTVIRHRGEDVVVARATYKRDAVTGEVVWWTERGDLLATIKTDWSGRSWQFYAGDKKTASFACMGDALVNATHERKGATLTCAYDPDSGARTLERGGDGQRASPARADGLPARALCAGDLLDPDALASELRRGGMLP